MIDQRPLETEEVRVRRVVQSEALTRDEARVEGSSTMESAGDDPTSSRARTRRTTLESTRCRSEPTSTGSPRPGLRGRRRFRRPTT
jgi:hypothetical protein